MEQKINEQNMLGEQKKLYTKNKQNKQNIPDEKIPVTMKLIIAEKPSVAKSIASALGASSRADGFYEGNGLLVSWCVGHLVSPMDAGGYDERFKKWRYDNLPILPEPFRYVLAPGKEDAFENLRALMDRPDVDTVVNACDVG